MTEEAVAEYEPVKKTDIELIGDWKDDQFTYEFNDGRSWVDGEEVMPDA
jgi:hypothetical protein